jgi:hypothetical protein
MQDIMALHRVFPRSPMIFLHRDPVQLVGSGASLAWNQMVIQSDEVDPAWVGREWLHQTRLRLEVVAEARRRIPARLQFDLDYEEVNADWRDAVARTYDFLGRDLTPRARAEMEAYVARAAAEHSFHRHRYSLAQFGLSADEVREELAPWCEAREALAA